METIKKSQQTGAISLKSGKSTISLLRYLAISLFFISFIHSAKAQDYQVLQDAFSKSHAYEARGNFADAIASLKKVYLEDSYEINLRLGWVTYLAGLFTESSAYYQKAINLKPYAIEAKFGYVNPASALGNWDQVVAQYNEILKIDPQNTLANYRMGSIYYGRRDFVKAEKYLEKVVNLYPFDYDSMVLFAWTNLKLGKLREAQVLFNKVLLNKPRDPSAVEGLSLIK
jgi:tetratricopeptide (TPR) repeat protein